MKEQSQKAAAILDEEWSEAEAIAAYGRRINPSLVRLMKFAGLAAVEVSAQGARVADASGRSFIDLASGYGALSHGHRHPRILAALEKAVSKMGLSTKVLLNEPAARLGELLAALTPEGLEFSFLANSGAEAVEAALKLARAATGRPGFVAAEGAFHGKTFGALSVTGRASFREPFEPLVPGVEFVPYGDARAIEEAVDDETAAVILEPVQGEGGVVIPPPGYLTRAGEIAHAAGALLVIDEVQTGLGRTGFFWGFEADDVRPDLVAVGKSLGGGLVPAGACVGTRAAWKPLIDDPFIHTSTFGGNPLAASVAAEALRVAVEEDFAGRARALGRIAAERLGRLAADAPEVVAEVRGRGLLLGIELRSPDLMGAVATETMRRGAIAGFTLNNLKVLRVEPPLVIDERELAEALDAVAGAVEAVRPLAERLETKDA